MLGVIYTYGLRLAAEQGNADAQYVLGAMYYSGRGTEPSDVEAAHWFRQAAVQGAEAWVTATRVARHRRPP